MQQKRQHRRLSFRRSPASRTVVFRAEDEAQTRDPQLGRLMLYQLSYFRKNIPYRSPPPPSRQPFGRPGGLRNSNRFLKWEVMDSNHRRRKPADLQSAPFDRSGNFPYFPPQRGGRCSAESDIPKNSGDFQPRSVFVPSHRQALRSRPASLASAFGADGGIRTPDQLITNQLLWPTELHRQNQPFWIAKVGIFFLSRKYSAIFFSTFRSFSKNRIRPVR